MILLLLFFLNPSAHAEWSCVNKDGWLMTCFSPASCRPLYPNCVAPKKVTDPACADARCRRAVRSSDDLPATEPLRPEPDPPKPPAPKPEPSKEAARPEKRVSPPPIRKHTEWTVPRGPTLGEIAAGKFAEVRELVRKARARPKPPPPKKASGLTAEEEARLFGSDSSPAPEKTDYSRDWPGYMSEAEHRRLVEELHANPALQDELRQRIASLSPSATAEEKEAAGLLTAILNEAEKKAGGSGTDGLPGL